MSIRVLVMGLPGSGKTTFSDALAGRIGASRLNADEIRREHNDWDFSVEGRERQTDRMFVLSRKSCTKYLVMDFICPFKSCRDKIEADYVIWMDTIIEGRFDDTNEMFVPPTKDEVDFRLSKYYTKDDLDFVVKELDKLNSV